MRQTLAILALILPLAACQIGGDRAAPDTAPAAPTGEITTTTLDAPAPVAASAPPTDAEKPAPTAPESTATETTAPAPETETVTETDAAASPIPDPVATPVPKSAAQLACEDDDGRWAKAGSGGGMACIYTTRDGGKRCDGKDDCDGECLARSRTCAPVKPLFGCNAVLMDNGAESTLCLD